ncbi:MAG: STAS domain-containing protein [Polyangiaceae bacterium]|nr:STAS domain-containing protein [Polyangiaceae bacterium]
MTTKNQLDAFLKSTLPTLRAIEGGDLSLHVTSEDSVERPLGALAASANALVEGLVQARHRTKRYQRELEEQIATIEKQRAAIRELSTPIIEVWTGVLCVPIVGVLDAERAADMTASLLRVIAQRKTPLTIIDVTGIENMETYATDHFLRMARAVRLLGAECVLSGVNANLAWTITEIGVDLADIRTHRTLREALQEYVRQQEAGTAGALKR